MNDVLLRLNNVHKYFHITKKTVVKAVNGLSLEMRRGEILGFVGESGCGKTTTGRLIVKLYNPDIGGIEFYGKNIWDFGKKENLEYRKKVQIIYQDPYASLDPLTVASDSIAEGLAIHKMYTGRKEKRERVIELLGMVGLNPEHANRFPHEFSGGQRQRLGIARALALEPELVVCDEPISALDVSIQAQVVNLLIKLKENMGLSYIFITHDLSMVRQISDRIAVMYLGSIVEMAPSSILYTRNKHPYTKALLSAIPIPDPSIERNRKRILLTGDAPDPINLEDNCSFAGRCAYATDICREAKPALAELETGHFVACHYSQDM